MKKVLIVPNYKTQECGEYIKACEAVGLKPTLSDSVTDEALYDALLIPGGIDVSPEFYGEENTDSIDTDADFDRLQLNIIDSFCKAEKPIMGVCRGCQLLNVYFGGTLCQNIEGHNIKDNGTHKAFVSSDKLSIIDFDGILDVNSTHHQCIKKAGKDIEIFARSEEGIPEGFVHTSKPVFGVQWHPEKLLDNTAEKSSGLWVYRLFAALIGE